MTLTLSTRDPDRRLPAWVDATQPTPADPPSIVDENGWMIWTDERDRLHRDGGPAIVRPDGSMEWHRHGDRHRLDGPAVIDSDGEMYFVDDVLHREDGPAVIVPDGKQFTVRLERVDQADGRGPGTETHTIIGPAEVWYLEDLVHRPAGEGPAVHSVELDLYAEEGVLHRTDGPAMLYRDGTHIWMRRGLIHRDGGPARRLTSDGTTEWWREGKLHRDDGPAVIYPDGLLVWYRDGKGQGSWTAGAEPPVGP